ncbi:MAG: hypothetical protein H2B05_03135 [Nitrosopumilaceae archaeon]|uniref:Uncharacterized protein n=1 Tax=Candidatus Nitrosomaritimum aestuariumsis TaxID=3342354 RepID=A0AC60W2Z8_9ARCH|nr:hypothetical protein [Nitrosopumilaceae archaeon]
MLKSVIGILISIIVILIGLVISITERLSTDLYWIGLILMGCGITSTVIFIIGKIRKWF